MLDPPPLPSRLTRVSTVVAVGTIGWLVAAAVLAAAGVFGLPLLTCVTGAGLGAVGWAIFSWQRTAARRGSRTAQRGLE